MLASMLNNHPEIVIPPETWWLSVACEMGVGQFPSRYLLRAFLLRIRRNFANSGKNVWVDLIDDFSKKNASFNGSYSELFELFELFSEEAKWHFQTVLFGEKTPAHTTFMRELNRSFPTHKKIILLRDPRDIVCSYFNAWFDKTDDSLYSILMILKCYLLNITYAIREIEPFLIKYEQLTSFPPAEMELLCTHLALPFVEDVMQLNPTTNPQEGHKNLNHPVFYNSKKYRKELPSHYIAAIEAVLGDEMEVLGYRREIKLGKHTAFTDRYMSINEKASTQVRAATALKDSRNWQPSKKVRLKALAEKVVRRS